MQKVAVILMNLGGPDNLEAVRPFLFNLFNDKAIIRLPQPFRWLLAKFISFRRTKTAQEIYSFMGGKSPIYEQTLQQVEELEKNLKSDHYQFKCFIHMRYWHPLADKVAKQVKEYQADKIILLPLYPQFSSTTTASSLSAMKQALHKIELTNNISEICCYHSQPKLIDAHAELINSELAKIKDKSQIRLLFSAHGLPKKIIEQGDPYQWQIEHSVNAIMKKISDDLNYKICYQSKVGPMEWLTPATDNEIIRASQEQKIIILIPIAFVSEHSETLVELDIEYKELAEEYGNKNYIRIPTLQINSNYISLLKELVLAKLDNKCPNFIKCPVKFKDCPHNKL